MKKHYAYSYRTWRVSNETLADVNVHFDDLKITHRKGNIVQVDDYYPFGLTFNSYQRSTSKENKWRFQGKEHIDDLGLNWDSFKWRNHQPDLCRFFNVDPLAESYYYNSPYAFSENKVVAHVEIEGLEAKSIEEVGQGFGELADLITNTETYKEIGKGFKQGASDVVEFVSDAVNAVVDVLTPTAGEVLVSGSSGAGAMESETDRKITTGVIDVDGMTSSGKSKSPSSNDPSVSIANMLGSVFEAATEFFGSGNSDSNSSSATKSDNKQKIIYTNSTTTIHNAGDVKDSTVLFRHQGDHVTITSPSGEITKTTGYKLAK